MDYNYALEKYPNDVDVLQNRGLLYVEMHEYNLAMNDFQEALAIDNSSGSPEYSIACGYGIQGDSKKVCEWLKLAISKDVRYHKESREDDSFDRVRNATCFVKLMRNVWYNIKRFVQGSTITINQSPKNPIEYKQYKIYGVVVVILVVIVFLGKPWKYVNNAGLYTSEQHTEIATLTPTVTPTPTLTPTPTIFPVSYDDLRKRIRSTDRENKDSYLVWLEGHRVHWNMEISFIADDGTVHLKCGWLFNTCYLNGLPRNTIVKLRDGQVLDFEASISQVTTILGISFWLDNPRYPLPTPTPTLTPTPRPTYTPTATLVPTATLTPRPVAINR